MKKSVKVAALLTLGLFVSGTLCAQVQETKTCRRR